MRDRAQLLGALRDHRCGRAAHLPEPELAQLVESIERRIAHLEEKLRELDRTRAESDAAPVNERT